VIKAMADSVPDSEYLVKSWRNEDGLPHSVINTIIQTHDGYLWIGTYVGLVRFDGVEFKQYSSSNVPDLEAGEIMQLFEDREGTLWVALLNGRLLAWKDGSVRIILPGDSASPQIISMAQQTNGTVWLETANGALGRVTNNGVEFVSPPSRSSNGQHLGLAVDASDQLWINTPQGLKLWREGKLISPDLALLEGKQVEGLALAQDGAVWVFCNSRLWKVRAGNVLAQLEVPKELSGVAGMLEASDGHFWIGSREGNLFCLNPGGSWIKIPQFGFQGLNRLLYEDHEGNVWRGGFGGGLTRIRPQIFKWHEFPEPSLDIYARTACSDREGNVWAILNNQILSRIPAGAQVPELWPNPNIPYAIKTVLVDHKNDLWAGTDGGHLYHLEHGAFVSRLNLGNNINSINDLFEDADHNIWVGYTGGPGLGVIPQGEAAQWHTLNDLSYPADVHVVAQSADGSIWVGTRYSGAFHRQNGHWLRLSVQEGLPSNYIRCFFADPDGTMWLGTLHGLCRWRDGKLVSIKSEQGLWNDSISYINDDNYGNIWMGSFSGVFRAKRADLNSFADGRSKSIQCVGYNRNDGLNSVECSGASQPAGAKTPDGRLWFATGGGLVSVDPGQIHENPLPPPVWIENMVVDGRTFPIKHSTSALTLAPGKRQIDFRFTALCLASPEKVLFRHKLDGLDADWSRPDAQRTVTYNYLPPGNYTFRVAACNNNGVWNNSGQAIQLTLQPFIWQTWWFKTGVGLLLAAGLAWGIRRRERWKVRQRFERLEREHAVDHERNRIARDIHDDLGANLTRIAILSQRVESASGNPTEVARWIHMIPPATDRTIQSLDEIVWAINPQHDSLESLATYLGRYAQEFFSLADIRCLLDMPTVLPSVPLSAEARHNLVLATREALQNIATHAGATEARIMLRLGEGELQIEISDNGRGFDPTVVSAAGNGLLNMQKRMEYIRGSLKILSRPSGGTTVQFTLPRSQFASPNTRQKFTAYDQPEK
jgi:signal transduction histidine kinase/ligand-binding sensor domain-containing protein